MSDEVLMGERPRNRRRPRAWWQWVLGLGLVGTAVVSLSLRWFMDTPPDWLVRLSALKPTPLVVPDGMKEAEAIPVAKGALSGSNVLLITLDTTRSDRLHCYGNAAIETPNLDRLATEGVLFSKAISPASTTLPSHCSILTGLYPFHHGARANGFTRLPDDKTTLAEILSARGYATAAFISAYVLDMRFGAGQGFSLYDDYIKGESDSGFRRNSERRGDITTDHAIEWLRKTGGDKKFFAWVHLFDPHQPYEPPAEYAEKYRSFPYDGEIAFADSQIGRLLQVLKELKVADHTLVVVIGDHGQGFLEHLELTHGYFVYDTTLHVPFIMNCGSKLGGGVHIPRWVSSVDVTPTVLSLLGVESNLKFDGLDLTTPPPPAPRAIFSDTLEGLDACGVAPLMAVREGSMKYIYGPDPELYDISADPYENTNIIAERPDAAERLKSLLTEFYDNDLAKGGYLASTEQLTEEELQQLRALGYVSLGGGGPLAPAAGALPDPKAIISTIYRVDRAYDIENREGPEAAVKYLDKLIEDAPDFYMALRLQSVYLIQAKDYERARQTLEHCLQIHPDIPFPLVPLGRVYAHLGQPEKAIESFRKALKVCPDDFGALAGLGHALMKRKRPQDAVDPLHRAIMVRPSDQSLIELFAKAMSLSGRTDEAIKVLQDRLAKNPDLGFVRNALGSLLLDKGRCDEVVPLMREGLKRYPDNLGLVNNLVYAIIRCKRPQDSLLETAVMMEQVCRESNYEVPEFLRTLGLVYAESHRFDEAISVSEKAIKLAQSLQLADLTLQLQENLRVFRAWKAKGVNPLSGVAGSVFFPLTQPTSAPAPSDAAKKP